MTDLNSPLKLEHFGSQDPCTKGQKTIPTAPKLAVPCCHILVWVRGFRRGGGGGLERNT